MTEKQGELLMLKDMMERHDATAEHVQECAKEQAEDTAKLAIAEGRKDFYELFDILGVFAHCLMLKENRCSIIGNMCIMLTASGVDPALVRKFFESQIDPARDCHPNCNACFKTEEDAVEYIPAFVHRGNDTIN